MLNTINISHVFVFDQQKALDFYVGNLGLEVSADMDFGMMRWLTVRTPGDPSHDILLELPGPPSMDEKTASQVRELVSKGASGFAAGFTTSDVKKTYETLKAKVSISPRSRTSTNTAPTSVCATRLATTSESSSLPQQRSRPAPRRKGDDPRAKVSDRRHRIVGKVDHHCPTCMRRGRRTTFYRGGVHPDPTARWLRPDTAPAQHCEP